MLSRAVLPLARSNLLPSTVRISAIQHPRWYAKKTPPYKVPDFVKSQKQNQPGEPQQQSDQQKPYSGEQAEFETNANPQENTTNRTSEAVSLPSTGIYHFI